MITVVIRGEHKQVQMYGKADRAMTLLEFYTMRQWKVRCDNVTSLVEQMAPHDLRLFDCDIRRLDWIQYFETYVLGVRRFIHKESLDNLPKARQMLTRFYLLRYVNAKVFKIHSRIHSIPQCYNPGLKIEENCLLIY